MDALPPHGDKTGKANGSVTCDTSPVFPVQHGLWGAGESWLLLQRLGPGAGGPVRVPRCLGLPSALSQGCALGHTSGLMRPVGVFWFFVTYLVF